MNPVGAVTSALAGLRAGMDRFSRAAERVTGTVEPGRLAENIVDMNLAGREIQAQVAVVRAEDEVLESLLDLFA